MQEDRYHELLDCQTALLDAIEAGVTCSDRLSLDAELAEIAAALATYMPAYKPLKPPQARGPANLAEIKTHS